MYSCPTAHGHKRRRAVLRRGLHGRVRARPRRVAQLADAFPAPAGTEKLVEKYKQNPTVVNGGIAAVAVAGASVFLLTEVEAILQVRTPPDPRRKPGTLLPMQWCRPR